MYAANRYDDIYSLYDRLCKSDPTEVVLATYSLGLMEFAGKASKATVWLIRLVRGQTGVENFLRFLWKKSPDTVHVMHYETALHSVYGKDAEDSDSVGGWSQREIDLLVDRMGWKEES